MELDMSQQPTKLDKMSFRSLLQLLVLAIILLVAIVLALSLIPNQLDLNSITLCKELCGMQNISAQIQCHDLGNNHKGALSFRLEFELDGINFEAWTNSQQKEYNLAYKIFPNNNCKNNPEFEKSLKLNMPSGLFSKQEKLDMISLGHADGLSDGSLSINFEITNAKKEDALVFEFIKLHYYGLGNTSNYVFVLKTSF